MSPPRGVASQGTFFEVYGNLVYDISYIIKKVCKTESEIPLHICRPQGATLRKVLSLKYTAILPKIT
ncbi:MAG: hypothetical protein ACLSAO_06390 [Anaerovoracaceae bacterium]